MGRKYLISHTVTFEPEEKKLSGDDGVSTVSASATYCLELLIERKGELVKHEELYDYAWRKFGMEPTAASLYQNISRLRGALKEAGLKEDIIRTMARRGFIIPGKVSIDLQKSATSEVTESDKSVCVAEEEQECADTGKPEENQAEMISPPSLKKEPSLIALSGKAKKAMLLVAVLLTFFIVSVYYLMPRDDFNYQFRRDECQFFLNTNSHDVDMLREFSGTLSLNCNEHRYVYITYYHSSDRVSVFTCLRPLSVLRNAYCYSDYFIKAIN